MNEVPRYGLLESDINQRLNDLLDLSIEIEKLNLPFRFDLIIYERIKENSLLDHIKRVGVNLFERE